MINVYTKEDYAKSYTEIIEILKHFEQKDLGKIPKQTIENYSKNKDRAHKFYYNPNLKLEEQNISKLTLILFANLYINYLANTNEKELIKQKDKEELRLLEKQKQEKYSVENIFKNRKKQILPDNENMSLIVVENKSILKRILDKIKTILKLT